MKIIFVIKVIGLFILVTCTVVSSLGFKDKSRSSTNCNSYKNNGNFGSQFGSHNIIQSPYNVKSSFGNRGTLSQTKWNPRVGRLGNGYDGASSHNINNFGLNGRADYGIGMKSNQILSLDGNAGVQTKLTPIREIPFEKRRFIELQRNKIGTPMYSPTVQYPQSVNNQVDSTMVHMQPCYENAAANTGFQSISGGLGYGTAVNTGFQSHSTNAAQGPFHVGGYGGVSASNTLSADGLIQGGLGINGFTGSTNHGLSTSGRLNINGAYDVGCTDTATMSMNGLATQEYNTLYGPKYIGLKTDGPYLPQQFTTINTADSTGYDLSLSEQEKIYLNHYGELGYKKSPIPVQQLYYHTNDNFDERKLTHGPTVVPINSQQRIITNVPKEKLHICNNAIRELPIPAPGRIDYINNYPSQITYTDLGYKPSVALNTNSFASTSLNNYDQTQRPIYGGSNIPYDTSSSTLSYNGRNNVYISDGVSSVPLILPMGTSSTYGVGTNTPQNLQLNGYRFSGVGINNVGTGGIVHTDIGGAINPLNEQTRWNLPSGNIRCD